MRAFEQHLYENGYSREEELNFWDCDKNKEIRLAAILSKMATFGGFDYEARGITHEKLYQMRNIFLLSRAAVRIHRRPQTEEIITTTTWEDGIRRAHMRRVYEMRDESKNLCISAKSDWILVDPIDRKILRPSSFKVKKLLPCPKEIDCPEPKKIRILQSNLQELGRRKIVWSDLDGNGHLYSGNYGDIIWNALPRDWQERPLLEFQINYHKEVTLEEELHLFSYQKDTIIQIEGRTEENLCFNAECLFK